MIHEDSAKDDLEINNLPNKLTLFRVILIPFVLLFLYLANSQFEFEPNMKSNLGWGAAWIFGLAAITDFFDGYIARKRNIVTVFGSFLDPIADKFLTVSSLIMLQYLERVPVFIVIILVLRELYMTSLRLLATNEGLVVPVNQMGKWKSAIMMLGIPLLMADEAWSLFPDMPFSIPGIFCIYIAAILSLWSAFTYTFNMVAKLKMARKLKKQNKNKQMDLFNE